MSFQITIEPSGRQFAVNPDQFILAAGISQGIGLPYGCKDGACGSCKCKKVSGSVEHGPHQSKALSAEEEENGFVLTCCAKPLSDVVLESKQVTEAGAFPIKKMPSRVMALEKHGIAATEEPIEEGAVEDDLNRQSRVLVPEADYDRAHRLFYAEREDEL